MLKKAKKRDKKETIFITIMLAWPMIHLLFFSIYMNISNFVMSLYQYDGDVRRFVGFLNYKNVFRDVFVFHGPIVKAFFNSLTVVPVNLFLILPLAIIFSVFLYKKIWGYRTFRVIFFLPSIISIVTLVMAFKYMFDDNFGPITLLVKKLGLDFLMGELGWFGTRASSYGMLSFFLLWSGLGYNILLIQGAMLRIPREILESAQLDGVGMVRELVQIIVPIIFSSLSTLVLFGVMGMFTMFIQPQLMFGTSIPDRLTIPLYIVNSTKSGNKSAQAGAATVGVLLTLFGAPIMLGVKAILNKLTPDIEY